MTQSDDHWLLKLIDSAKTPYPLRGGRTRPEPEPKPRSVPKRNPRYKHSTQKSNFFEKRAGQLMMRKFFRTPAYYAFRAIYIAAKPLSVSQIVQEAPGNISKYQIEIGLDKLVKAGRRWKHWVRVEKTKDGLYTTKDVRRWT